MFLNTCDVDSKKQKTMKKDKLKKKKSTSACA